MGGEIKGLDLLVLGIGHLDERGGKLVKFWGMDLKRVKRVFISSSST